LYSWIAAQLIFGLGACHRVTASILFRNYTVVVDQIILCARAISVSACYDKQHVYVPICNRFQAGRTGEPIAVKYKLFRWVPALTPSFEGKSLTQGHKVSSQKTKVLGGSQRWRFRDPSLRRFDTVAECDRRTGGRTHADGITCCRAQKLRYTYCVGLHCTFRWRSLLKFSAHCIRAYNVISVDTIFLSCNFIFCYFVLCNFNGSSFPCLSFLVNPFVPGCVSKFCKCICDWATLQKTGNSGWSW